MELITNLEQAAIAFRDGCVATIGNFDGVHLGHQQLVGEVVQCANELGVPSVVITFDPHPLRFMRGAAAPASIITVPYKLACFEALGVSHVLLLNFDMALASMTPEEFVDQILVQALHVKHLFVGYDYAFGKGRRGNADVLRTLGKTRGFGVTQLAPVLYNNEVVSSTRIRECLSIGDMRTAYCLLNRPHTVEGIVTHGQGRGGKMLGFATANIERNQDILLPPSGVYAVKIFFLDANGNVCAGAKAVSGVANVGVNPTFGNEGLHLEVHILDFDKDIYGQKIRVAFYSRLRAEKSFASIDALKKQIQTDVDEARNILENCEQKMACLCCTA